MGSTDALSIIYRDIIITVFRDMLWENETELIQYTINTFKELENLNYTLEKIVEKYNLVHLSTGDMIRKEIAEGTELGKMAQDIINGESCCLMNLW